MEQVALSPEKILHSIGVHKKSVVADFGCGPGVFALPAAMLTDETVYAIDIRTAMLDVCEREASQYHLDNISIKHANLEREGGSDLGQASVDFVIMRKIISQNKRKDQLFKEAFRILKDSGKLLVIGWHGEAIIGPDADDRVPQEVMRDLGQRAGFEKPEEMLVNFHHYGLVFVK